MTLSEVVVSAVILGVSSQVSLQGWSRVSHAVATADDFEHKHLLVEQRLLITCRRLATSSLVDPLCRWNREAVVNVVTDLPADPQLSLSWTFEPALDGLWFAVRAADHSASQLLMRSQLFTPAGLGHCAREGADAS
ncbi:hypothetical protein KR52_12970 [Synechococcus sp. KORDI-52]|uniref:hypothetical protein n=1 Tax=Synechococcus sp. KORDI-52 TaxID=585425 RepID=UPI0004E097D1|nr:hypothetical protein [Synechococcus sp. KORDI-52]AII50037.1 hypothetical protein KR52_12970 [Synechococcus sp. KORDI-52]